MGNLALRWGLLGAGRIAAKFSADLKTAGLNVAAVASRDPERARAFAAEAGIPRYYGSYQALLADPGVDAVYISLPNHLHAEWCVRAAEAGKHILCEKPGALDGVECSRLLGAARRAGVFYMEGFMYRCHPLWDLARALIEDGRIGTLQRLESAFCFDMGFKPEDIRQRLDAAGGALLDVGCYCLSFSRMLAGCEPVGIEARSELGAETGVDECTTARLEFPTGLIANFECAIRRPRLHHAVAIGQSGRLEIPSPWHPDPDRAEIRIVIPGEDDEVYHTGDGLPLFAREAMQVAEYIDDRQCPAMNWKDSLAQAQSLASLRRAAGHIQ